MLLIFLFSLSLSACGVFNSSEYNPSTTTSSPDLIASYNYFTFDEAVLNFATDIVIAQYVGSRPFGESEMEFEFVVSERLLGNATERIFIYAGGNIHAHVSGHEREVDYISGSLTFSPGVDYLLPLSRINSPYSNRYDGGDNFIFIFNIVIEPNTPSTSTMYSEFLSLHTTGLDIDEDTTTWEILSFVEGLAKQIERETQWERVFIHSQEMEDIIKGSPDVWVIELNEPRSLYIDFPSTGSGISTDIYYITVVQSLKGDREVGDELILSFFPDTVLTGERHIVAVTPIREGSNRYNFTSRNSLFRMDQLEEIMMILDDDY